MDKQERLILDSLDKINSIYWDILKYFDIVHEHICKTEPRIHIHIQNRWSIISDSFLGEKSGILMLRIFNLTTPRFSDHPIVEKYIHSKGLLTLVLSGKKGEYFLLNNENKHA